jgi:hypothetical protein
VVVEAQTTQSQHVETLDARQWDFSKRLSLSGNWSIVENKLVDPHDLHKENLTTAVFPSLWNDRRADGKGSGCATYVIDVILPESVDELALEISPPYTSYNVWVSGQLMLSAGKVGINKEETVPKWVYQTVSFQNGADTLQIVLQLANFHHHKGGALNPIYLGSKDRIQKHANWSIGSNVFEASVLFLEGIIFLFLYQRKNRVVILYFALLCLTWSVRSLFSNLYPPVLIFPDIPWMLVVRIEYITLYLTVIWAALFFNSLFKDFSNVIFTYLPVAINVFFIVFTLFAPVTVFTRWVSIYLGVAALVILFGVALIVRALIVDKEGSWFLMSTIWIGILIFGYDMAAYHSSFSYNIVLLNIGYVLIFLLTTIALLMHLGLIKGKLKENELMTMKDLYPPR